MIAYKFLRNERIGPFSGFRWPAPGEWVHADEGLVACQRGIHACRTRDLPWWLADELWEIELDGRVQVEQHKIVAAAGRLRSRVGGWTPARAQEFAEACGWRAHERALQALTHIGQTEAAAALGACMTLDDALTVARRLAEAIPDIKVSLTIARRGALRALTGAPATSAYIAAHAAMRLDGSAGYEAEREWQSSWLVERLGLHVDS